MKVKKIDVELAEKLQDGKKSIVEQIGRIIVGQEHVVEELLITLFASGHCLLVGVPGLAKTLLISSLADILDLKFSRIQFTPDLMPSDITGSEILQEDRATRDSDGRVKLHADIAHPINSACREKVQSAILAAYRMELERSKQPGYKSSYDDYESDYDESYDGVLQSLHRPPAKKTNMGDPKTAKVKAGAGNRFGEGIG